MYRFTYLQIQYKYGKETKRKLKVDFIRFFDNKNRIPTCCSYFFLFSFFFLFFFLCTLYTYGDKQIQSRCYTQFLIYLKLQVKLYIMYIHTHTLRILTGNNDIYFYSSKTLQNIYSDLTTRNKPTFTI